MWAAWLVRACMHAGDMMATPDMHAGDMMATPELPMAFSQDPEASDALMRYHAPASGDPYNDGAPDTQNEAAAGDLADTQVRR